MHIAEATGGGAGRHLRYVICGLRNAGLAADAILSPRRGDPDFPALCETLRAAGATVHLLPMGRLPGLADPAALFRLRRLLRDLRPDLIHTHCAKAGLLGRLAAAPLRPHTRLLHTPHSFFFEGLRNPLLARAGIRLERWLGAVTDRLVCIADAERAVALRHRLVPESAITVIPNGLPATFADRLLPRARARRALSLADDLTAVAIPARLVAKKGHDTALAAVARLPESVRRRICLLVIGDGPLENRLRRRARTLGVDPHLRFIGFLPEAARTLRAFDASLLLSRYEGLPYQILEALAAGIPMIASDIPGNRPPAPDPPVHSIPADSPEAAARMLTRVVEDPSLQTDAASRGPAWVARHFALDTQIAGLIRCYRQLASTAAAAPPS